MLTISLIADRIMGGRYAKIEYYGYALDFSGVWYLKPTITFITTQDRCLDLWYPVPLTVPFRIRAAWLSTIINHLFLQILLIY